MIVNRCRSDHESANASSAAVRPVLKLKKPIIFYKFIGLQRRAIDLVSGNHELVSPTGMVKTPRL